MKPHMKHIKETMARKQAANEAGNKETAYNHYKNKVAIAQKYFKNEEIVQELEREMERVKNDKKIGDAIYLQGVANAQNACMVAIARIISELKGEK